MPVLPADPYHHVRRILLAALCTVLGACSSTTMSSSALNPVNWITPYRVDVIQGNFVSREQVEQLQPGMSREQVKAVLGTPLVASLFHADRWDYVFTLKRQGVEPQLFKYAVFFKGDQLERFAGDTMPSDADFISILSNKRKLGEIPVLQASEAQLKAAEKPSASRTRAEPLPEPATTGSVPAAYPPLEGPRP